MTAERHCDTAGCGEPVTQVTRCEKDGHARHHHSCCPIPCRTGTTTTDLGQTLTCTHGWLMRDDTWVHVLCGC